MLPVFQDGVITVQKGSMNFSVHPNIVYDTLLGGEVTGETYEANLLGFLQHISRSFKSVYCNARWWVKGCAKPSTEPFKWSQSERAVSAHVTYIPLWCPWPAALDSRICRSYRRVHLCYAYISPFVVYPFQLSG